MRSHTPTPMTPSIYGGCDFPARPSLSVLEQQVVWSPLVNPAVLLIDTAPSFLPSPPPLAPADGRESPEGLYAIHEAYTDAQLLYLTGCDVGCASSIVLPLDSDLPDRLQAVLRLWHAANAGPVPHDARVTPYQRRRMRQMMQAADGRSNGATYREIAIAMFGSERIASEPWRTSALRDTVIGLIESASALIEGGYRRLLRHKRKG